MKDNPCRYCEKRQIGCHGTCKEYIEWRKYNIWIKQKAKEKNKYYE